MIISDLDLYARPQKRVRINRRRWINLLDLGEGGPSVVLCGGDHSTTLVWARVHSKLARDFRVVAYDRAGLGFSDPGPFPRTTPRVVGDLRAALKAAGIAPPYVLVGASNGGFETRWFARHHPEEVVGMVLVDTAADDWTLRQQAAAPSWRPAWKNYLNQLRYVAACARSGALRPGLAEYAQYVPEPNAQLPEALNLQRRDAALTAGYWRTHISECEAIETASALGGPDTRALLGDLPLVVLSAGLRSAPPLPTEEAEAFLATLEAGQDALAALSTRGVRRHVTDSGHNIQIDRPEVVIGAVAEVIALAPTGRQPSTTPPR
ncbi:alpha/beta hydrolase [Phenylobacterium sp.]|uniref:alpha/beta fold hydrolase n=1 Tax=Phenylobacterium sp. TaxID=1871053 RepID=UPI0030F4A6A7